MLRPKEVHLVQRQLSKMEIDFALEPRRYKSYSASALGFVENYAEHYLFGNRSKTNQIPTNEKSGQRRA